MSTLKNGRATEVDGISLETLHAMFEDPGWQPIIAEPLHDSFYRGEIRAWVAEGASVRLPSNLLPQLWTETRPITLKLDP